MTKVIFVFTGVFVGAVVYELLTRANPELTRKVEDFARKKIDGVSGTNHNSEVYESHKHDKKI
jgi:hypothetical protein